MDWSFLLLNWDDVKTRVDLVTISWSRSIILVYNQEKTSCNSLKTIVNSSISYGEQEAQMEMLLVTSRVTKMSVCIDGDMFEKFPSSKESGWE